MKYIYADITDINSITKKIKKNFAYVINLINNSNHSKKKETYKNNYIATKNISNFFLKKKLTLFIQIGSSFEYGHTRSPQKEHFIAKPKSFFGKAKLASTKYLLNLYIKKRFPVTVLRLYNIYGPHQDINRFIPIVINSCKIKKDFPCSHGRQSRDFLYISDLIEVIFLTMKNSSVKGEIINIGSGIPIKIKDIIKNIANHYKSGNPIFNKIKLRKEETLLVYPNLDKVKKILKWKAKINIVTGLKKTIEFFNGN